MELFGLNPQLITGLLFIAGFICFAIGVATPNYTGLDQKVWNLPHSEEHLTIIRDNSRAWRWARAWTVASTIALLIAVSLLAFLMDEMGGTILALSAWLIFLLGAVCWTVGIAFQMAVEPQLVSNTNWNTSVESWFPAIEAWSIMLQSLSLTMGYIALAFLGLGALQTALLPIWVALILLLFGLAAGIAMITNKPLYPETDFSIAAIPAWLYLLFLFLGVFLII